MKPIGKELFISKPFCEIAEIQIKEPIKNEIRIYCTQYPDKFNFQVRSRNQIDGKHGYPKKKERDFISNVTVSINEMKEIVKFMENYKNL